MKKYLYLLAAVFPALLGSCKEIEQQMDETTCFYSPVCSLPMMFSEPEEPTSAQLEYVKNYFKEAETQLMNRNFDPETGWQKYIDGNMRKSSFIAKKKGGKLYMPHLWDYDIALGNSQNHKNEFLKHFINRRIAWLDGKFSIKDGEIFN